LQSGYGALVRDIAKMAEPSPGIKVTMWSFRKRNDDRNGEAASIR